MTVKLSIIIPSIGRPHLRQCLSALLDSVASSALHVSEIIVTDDSKIEARSIVREFSYANLILLEGPGRGPAANRNYGATKATGLYLVFIDDDCIPEPGLIQALVRAAENNPTYKVFEGRTKEQAPHTSLDEYAPINNSGGYLWACNFMIRRDLFVEMGGFDERFSYAAMEDVEFRTRLTLLKEMFLFVPEACVVHPWRKLPSWKELLEHQSSTLKFISIHTDQRKVITPKYYLKIVLTGLIRETLPGLFRYKGRGVFSAMRQHVAHLVMACRLCLLR